MQVRELSICITILLRAAAAGKIRRVPSLSGRLHFDALAILAHFAAAGLALGAAATSLPYRPAA
jgi:hypothetical protein